MEFWVFYPERQEVSLQTLPRIGESLFLRFESKFGCPTSQSR